MDNSTSKATKPNNATNQLPDFETLYQHVVTMIKMENPEFNTIPGKLKQDFLNLKELFLNDQLALISELSNTKALPSAMVRVINAFPWFDTLPDDILKEIDSHMDKPKGTSALVRTDKRAYTLFQMDRLSSTFLQHVAHGKQDKAEEIFSKFMLKQVEKKQVLFCTPGLLTDYSGREFHCTAYEYAYWAKDKHMCRMLEKHMDANTKAWMLKRCEAIDKNGLTYKQHGQVKNSKHFDFMPLIMVYQNYINKYDDWYKMNNWRAIKAAWMEVGIAQSDLPVHVLNEYCRKDRSFDPTLEFNENQLPRELTFYNFNTNAEETLFPVVVSTSSGLGIDFALISGRGCEALGALSPRLWQGPSKDLEMIICLDEVRTADLSQSLDNLKLDCPMHKFGN